MVDSTASSAPVLVPAPGAPGPTVPCAVRGCACRDRGQRVNVPNAVTAVRTVASLALTIAAAGQTAGKLLLFGAARSRGPARLLGRLRTRGARAGVVHVPGPVAPGQETLPLPDTACGPVPRLLGRLSRATRGANAAGTSLLSGRSGPAVVLVSGSVGLPPLLAVAFYAGSSTMRARTFVAACLTGRTARFAVLALVPGLLAPELF